MTNENLYEAIGEIDEKHIIEAKAVKKVKKPIWIKWGAVACLVLFCITCVSIVNRQRNSIPLSDNSFNVTVRYTNKPLIISSSSSLIELTEEELFTYFNTAIFKGTVLSVKNIEVNFNGDKEYRAIAEIEVEKVYRGSCNVGDTVSVMLPCPIGNGIWVTDTNTVSAMKTGTTGIFMPIIYDENSIWEQNGARLIKKDIADYGFADGERYAFIEAENGLVFDRIAYESIASAATLDEIEDYIQIMLSNISAQEE